MPDLSNYQNAKNEASNSLAEMQAGNMPTSGKMAQTSIDKFKKWIDDGSLMNLTDTETNSVTDCL